MSSRKYAAHFPSKYLVLGSWPFLYFENKFLPSQTKKSDCARHDFIILLLTINKTQWPGSILNQAPKKFKQKISSKKWWLQCYTGNLINWRWGAFTLGKNETAAWQFGMLPGYWVLFVVRRRIMNPCLVIYYKALIWHHQIFFVRFIKKKHLVRIHFQNEEEVINAVIGYFDGKYSVYLWDGIFNLLNRWKKCINLNSGYVEK